MTLRPYQQQALDAIKRNPRTRGIVAIPTGTGKGHIVPDIVKTLQARSALFLAHREELINQLRDHLEGGLNWMQVEVEQSGRRASSFTPYIVASVPTLTASKCKRLLNMAPRRFDMIVCDEAHHATADSYCEIWKHFGILDQDGNKPPVPAIPLIGLTATPARGDNVGLHNVFDQIIYQYSLKQAIEDGWLVPIHAYSVQTNVNLDKVKIRRGDYATKDLSEAVATKERNEAVYDACQKNAKGLKTLIFCVDVEHSAQMAEMFRAHGRPAKHIDGKMNSYQRSSIIEWFGKTPGAVLCNCQIVTEGTDIPSVECVVMARPTKSSTLYMQCIGRGTRLAKGAYDYAESVRMGKDKMILLDITDSSAEVGHAAVNVGSIFGAPFPRKKLTGQNIVDEVKQQEIDLKAGKYEQGATQAVNTTTIRFDLWAKPEPVKGSKMQWMDRGGVLVLNLADKGTVELQSDLLDRWAVSHIARGNRIAEVVVEGLSGRDAAVKYAENWVNENHAETVRLTKKDAPWRRKPPTRKQRDLCRKFHITVPTGATCGDVANAIDRFFNRNKPQQRMAR